MLIGAVNLTYLQELDNPDYGFANVTITGFLEHLKDQYGRINDKELEANQEKLKTAWNPDKPIKNLWTNVNAIHQFTIASNSAINKNTTISLLLIMFDQSGLMETACNKWCNNPM